VRIGAASMLAGGAKDWLSDLGSSLLGISHLLCGHEVVLPKRSLDADLVCCRVSTELAISDIDVRQGTLVSSAPGTMKGTTRPIERTMPSTGMNTVAWPRPSWNSSLAYSPPAQGLCRIGG